METETRVIERATEPLIAEPLVESSDDEVEIIEARLVNQPPAKRHKPDNGDNNLVEQLPIVRPEAAPVSQTVPAGPVVENCPNGVPASFNQFVPDPIEPSQQERDTLEKTSVDNCSVIQSYQGREKSDVSKRRTFEFLFGPYVPLFKTEDKIIVDVLGVVDEYNLYTHKTPIRRRLVGEISSGDSILETPSLITPLLLKKKTIWPSRQVEITNTDNNSDVEIIEKVDGNQRDMLVTIESRYRDPESYVKDTIIKNLTSTTRNVPIDRQETILAIDDYYGSSAGQILFGIGFSLVNEFTMEERFRRLNHKIRRGEDGLIAEYDALKKKLGRTKNSNRHFKLGEPTECHGCAFKTEFSTVLEHHLEMPHKNSSKYQCNWCGFKTKDPTQIINHTIVIHRKYRCYHETPLQVHCCRYCEFETNSKRKYTSHITKCEKMYQAQYNMAPDEPIDYPGLTAKCVDQLDILTYENTLKALRMAAYNPHQIKVSSNIRGLDGLPILLIPKSSPAATILDRACKQLAIPISEAASVYQNPNAIIGRGSLNDERSSVETQGRPVSSNLLRLLASNSSSNNLPEPKTSILQHPRPQSAFVNGMSVAKNTQTVVMPPSNRNSVLRKNANPSNHRHQRQSLPQMLSRIRADPGCIASDDSTFVICEICDAYIDNISFFKSHMQWVHRVKIHTRVLESLKPPLNCQKCNWRYFTDQGLERHLLGSHGLVTPNMQEMADQEKDSGRCTICGVRCASKLVSHIKDVHKVNLKPAQLSYKCTVCAATFCMYRHFENHVYRVHG